ncbi:MAG TPA: GNAT family protein [Clostridia bacterium]|nr:GNAT family protein [Clostridia bacterium]
MNITLRAWTIDDAPSLAAILNNENILAGFRDGIPYPYTEEHAREFIDMQLRADPDKVLAFAIAADEEVVGSITVSRQDNINYLSAEIGYFIAEAHWGKGFATRAVKLACQTVFEKTDIIRVFGMSFTDNPASCRVLEKSGFELEGVLRKSAIKKGKIRDVSVYARLK